MCNTGGLIGWSIVFKQGAAYAIFSNKFNDYWQFGTDIGGLDNYIGGLDSIVDCLVKDSTYY